MNEKIENKAVELSDEELEKASGGYEAIEVTTNDGIVTILCNTDHVGFKTFRQAFYKGKVCDHYIRKIHDGCSKGCANCYNYQVIIGALDPVATSVLLEDGYSIDQYDQRGK